MVSMAASDINRRNRFNRCSMGNSNGASFGLIIAYPPTTLPEGEKIINKLTIMPINKRNNAKRIDRGALSRLKNAEKDFVVVFFSLIFQTDMVFYSTFEKAFLPLKQTKTDLHDNGLIYHDENSVKG
jgi:hypothetical protein